MSSASSRNEPSMDEILASIRRIIESGEEPALGTAEAASSSASARTLDVPLPSQPAGTAFSPLPRFDVHYLSPTDERGADYSDDLRELEAAEFDREDNRHGSTEDVLDNETKALHDSSETWNRIPAESAETQPELEIAAARDAEHDRSPPAVPPPAGNENAAPVENDDSERADQAANARNFSFEFDDEAFEAALQVDAWHSNAPAPRVAETPDPEPVADASPPLQVEMPASVIDGASALLSAQAGDQVAAAFDDLTRAIRDGQMRSMEEMAREMMRPMLQEWLDDNLPRIVERLVRDEIERIARGPRR